MSDSNEPTGAAGPDLQPDSPPNNDQQKDAPTGQPDQGSPTGQDNQSPAPPAKPQTPQEDTAPKSESAESPPADTPDKEPQQPDRQSADMSSEQSADNAGSKPDKPQRKPRGPKSGKPAGRAQGQSRGPRGSGPNTPRRKPGKPPKGPSVVIRYGIMGHIGQFRHNLEPAPARGVNVVIRTDRGVELGEVLTVVADEPACGCITPERLEEHIKSNGPDYPFRRDGKILRLANPQDLIDQRHLNSSARDERKFCAEEIKDRKLDMKLVAVEHLLGGERIIFYFLAEHRVDFRDLVHKLASQYHTRIEMRQVGARDEARLVGDYERCGQECCCKQFLKGLQPVSMRMAKTQKATLDPSKISGRCGRLMCCLRYEDQCYRDLKKCLPHKNIWVKTCDKIGRVTGTQILTQLVQVQLPDGSRGVFANEDIIERNVDPPKPPEPAAAKSSRQSDRKSDRGRKQQSPAQTKQRGKPADAKKETGPQRKPKPEPKPKRQRQPRAEAKELDPGWGALLGENITKDQSGDTPKPDPTAQPPEETEKKPLPETPEKKPGDQQSPQGAGGKKRKKRRRRRGRRSKGKKQGG